MMRGEIMRKSTVYLLINRSISGFIAVIGLKLLNWKYEWIIFSENTSIYNTIITFLFIFSLIFLNGFVYKKFLFPKSKNDDI